MQDRFQLLLQGAAVPLCAQFQPFFVEMIAPILYPVQELNRKTHEYASCVFLRAFPAGTTGMEFACAKRATGGCVLGHIMQKWLWNANLDYSDFPEEPRENQNNGENFKEQKKEALLQSRRIAWLTA